ncbi:hypothetical protein SDRG_01869 [Saprolegnia diclina VS20]|uniref:AGC-kinase C-terminal domain-containing protein n=1 Tax=Saprolegnia diclina (strain VS20) TaxID=1156394 RepID=T0R370_SAPDV|nr:hypothetical protein SDRG_01869 [Saprolegnia diclina VS20]EQC40800.1 hypothetical protein SDRG_01869 [Saprolegnia diclina VS20]|eukprot:XP_008605644.1 hypothetical protein SDRG_01869 [Saprolegnia diclina VS20]
MEAGDDGSAAARAVEAVLARELKRPKLERAPFNPTDHGLREDFRLTDFSALKG